MATYKVLLFEPVHEAGIEHLAQNDAEITYAKGFSPEEIHEAIVDVDAILARAQGYIDGPAMDLAPRLKVIGRHGIGVDNIDVNAATERGIQVVNTPHAPAESVAEFVLMSMIALPRRIAQADRATRDLDWGFRNRVHAPELLGKTIGVVGFGRIGRRIAEICALGFRMNVLYSDEIAASPDEESRLSARKVDLKNLLSESDFVSLNVPLLPGTHHMIDGQALAAMQSHAYLINCSRGPVVDEAALITALKEGQIAGAAIDVYEKEPVEAGNGLLGLDNVLLAPHCSGHSQESAVNMSMVAADIVKVLNGQVPEHPVNHPETPRRELS